MEIESNLDSTRKLASLRHVENVTKHNNADALEIVTLQDMFWQVITRLGDVHVGDQVLYFEIDSLLPVSAPWFPESFKKDTLLIDGQNYFRVKTIKLRKEISQGLILPIDDKLKQVLGGLSNAPDGTDLTQILQIKKYEPNVKLDTLSSGQEGIAFPSHLVSKTDETRVQNCKADFLALFGRPYDITVKCDGMSGTFLIDPETSEFLVCSRNFVLPLPQDIAFDVDGKNNHWRIALKYNLEKLLRCEASQGSYYAIQGEICGPKIQKNLLGLQNIQFFIFNVIDIKHGRRLTYSEVEVFCKSHGLIPVPLVEQGDSFSYSKISEMLTLAQGYYTNTKNHREGLVVRGHKISFKVINNDYLLKNDY